MESAWEALARLELLPENPDQRPDFAFGTDLLDDLTRLWSEAAHRSRGTAATRCQRIAQRLKAWQRRGARLTLRITGVAGPHLDGWLGRRMVWWPAGSVSGRRVGVISSRLGRELDARKSWFTALRTACMNLDSGRDVLVTARSISTHKFVQRAGALFAVPVLQLEIWDQVDQAASKWGRTLLASDPDSDDRQLRLSLSPICGEGTVDPRLTETPAADRAVAALSDHLIVLSARAGGNVDRVVTSRLASPDYPAASVFLALGNDLVPGGLAEPWMDAGAIGWYVWDTEDSSESPTAAPWQTADDHLRRSAPIRRLPPEFQGDLLTHWTRRRSGPWPDQREVDYLDDLILDRAGADHSAFAALWRIVRTRRLVATSETVRGDQPVVCFTQVPLVELPRWRSFRPHRSRWDFEPYGISIDRRWLVQRGAQPVRYGDEQFWHSLPEKERPYFQKRFTESRGGSRIDWSIEREWRHPGDVQLDQLPPDAAIVFVPTLGHARQIATISPWPVIVLD